MSIYAFHYTSHLFEFRNKCCTWHWLYVVWRRQLDDDLSGGTIPSKPRPPPIKPLDLDAPHPDESSTARRQTTFPKTTTAMIGWAQSLSPLLSDVRPLERHARPCGDIRKTFGWPWDAEWSHSTASSVPLVWICEFSTVKHMAYLRKRNVAPKVRQIWQWFKGESFHTYTVAYMTVINFACSLILHINVLNMLVLRVYRAKLRKSWIFLQFEVLNTSVFQR